MRRWRTLRDKLTLISHQLTLILHVSLGCDRKPQHQVETPTAAPGEHGDSGFHGDTDAHWPLKSSNFLPDHSSELVSNMDMFIT